MVKKVNSSTIVNNQHFQLLIKQKKKPTNCFNGEAKQKMYELETTHFILLFYLEQL